MKKIISIFLMLASLTMVAQNVVVNGPPALKLYSGSRNPNNSILYPQAGELFLESSPNGAGSLWIDTNGKSNGWTQIPIYQGSSGTPGWSLTGNAGTNTSTNFIGTTDNNGFQIYTDDSLRLLIDNLGNIFAGYVPFIHLNALNELKSSTNIIDFETGTSLTFNGQQFPQADGSANQVLTTNGSGVDSWQTITTPLASGRVGIGSAAGFLTSDTGLRYTTGGNLYTGTPASAGAVYTGTLQLQSASGYVNLQPNVSTSSYTLSLPGNNVATGLVLMGSGAGATTWQYPLGSGTLDSVATSGASISLSAPGNYVLKASGTISTITINLPAGTTNAEIYLSTDVAVTTITWGTSGGSAHPAFTSLTAGQFIRLKYLNGNWY